MVLNNRLHIFLQITPKCWPLILVSDIPAAAMHEFYVNDYFPVDVNYGLIGTIIAHEMAHAFDQEVG